MKQIVQSPRTGELKLVEVPAPSPARGQVLVRNHYSVVSPGTEKMAVSFGRKSLLGKARSRPDLVQQVTRKLRQEGPLSTYRAVRTRLDAPQPLGYSCAGVVEAVGEGVSQFARGDRVACAGAGYANHAELVVVPRNLVAGVPEGVSLDQAAFATVGAVALQGLRVAQPSLGEIAAVIGLGLIGQLAAQLLRANGCRVLGLDPNPERVKQAMAQGADWGAAPDHLSPSWKDQVTGGYGVDLALVAASAQDSSPLQLAAELCRLKGRISLVGAMPMELDRRIFYEKELELRVSMSYGPGRYDRNYEEVGLDYPLPFVRWTENRNLEAFLTLIASGSVHPDRLDTEVIPFTDAERVYEELGKGESRSLSIVFRYGAPLSAARTLPLAPARKVQPRDQLGVAFLGAGTYAKDVLLPALRRCKNVRRVAVVTATGTSARRTAERFGFAACGTDPAAVLQDPDIGLVFVATPHDTHAELAVRALRAGKAVWLEKPVGLTREEVDEVLSAARETDGFLTVGYNRRFSPHARATREAFDGRRGPIAIHYCVAAGAPPRATWVTDPQVGGGRIVGEVCHFVDLCTYVVGSPPASVFGWALGRDPQTDDSLVATLGFADGSTATIEYLSQASPDLPKERFEVSAEGRTVRCENFRTTRVSGSKAVKTLNQDKGQATAVAEVVEAVRTGRPSSFTLEEIAAVSRTTFAILESVQTGQVARIEP